MWQQYIAHPLHTVMQWMNEIVIECFLQNLVAIPNHMQYYRLIISGTSYDCANETHGELSVSD